jgi:hypothetical protein
VLEEAPSAGGEHFGNRAGDGSADEGDCLQRLAPTPLCNSADIIIQSTDQFGGFAVGRNAERVGLLRRQDVGGLAKLVGDLRVLPAGAILTPSRGRAVSRLI